ncbi:MAG: 3-hydroxyanthranilate 3,4-dioxygenase [Saprospiraceae bacterium]|nr:3-hydroxyanthranilate 3,4-dioxygenase [Saprospiraceae bacterium]MBP7679432.1 3-hydroxyanthranilate 3,4-dioxygenase [Saprospiraceae bacterium]
MAITQPFNIHKWVDENRHLLKPPVGNKQIYFGNDDYIVMVVGGPNGRKDYHYEDGEELFYQLEGDISVKIINENGEPETIHIQEGDMFLLPPHIPHSPQRPANTVGIVIERYRKPGEMDKLMWFCDSCHAPLHEATFALKDIGTQIKQAIEDFRANETQRTCQRCQAVLEV